MQLNDLVSPVKRKKIKRLGRGRGSGHGKTSGRGHKGEKARKGRLFFVGFAGGNLPYFRRIPKRGFHHRKKILFQIVNLHQINEKFKENETVNPKELFSRRLIKDEKGLVKVLGKGNVDKPLTIYAHKVSEKARQKIEKAGGRVECLAL